LNRPPPQFWLLARDLRFCRRGGSVNRPPRPMMVLRSHSHCVTLAPSAFGGRVDRRPVFPSSVQPLRNKNVQLMTNRPLHIVCVGAYFRRGLTEAESRRRARQATDFSTEVYKRPAVRPPPQRFTQTVTARVYDRNAAKCRQAFGILGGSITTIDPYSAVLLS